MKGFFIPVVLLAIFLSSHFATVALGANKVEDIFDRFESGKKYSLYRLGQNTELLGSLKFAEDFKTVEFDSETEQLRDVSVTTEIVKMFFVISFDSYKLMFKNNSFNKNEIFCVLQIGEYNIGDCVLAPEDSPYSPPSVLNKDARKDFKKEYRKYDPEISSGSRSSYEDKPPTYSDLPWPVGEKICTIS